MKIAIADDHRLFRESLKALLDARGYRVVGEAGNGEEAIALVARLRPDLILMDLNMPGMDGIEATRRIATEHPATRVVVLTASDDDALLFGAVKAGAQGYLLKDLESDQFFALLEAAGRGEPAMTPALARRLLIEFRSPGRRAAKDPDALTERERSVLELMVAGTTSNRQLARQLGLSENTVKSHVRGILDKLRLHDRTQAVSFALRAGLVGTPRPDRKP